MWRRSRCYGWCRWRLSAELCAAFEFARLYRRWLVMRVLAVMLASLGYLFSKTGSGCRSDGDCFFCAGVVCGLLVSAMRSCLLCGRMDRGRLLLFYLSIAAGGAGVTFWAVVSPVVFRSNYDAPLAFAVYGFCGCGGDLEDGWQLRMLWCVGSALAVVLLVAGADAVCA